MSAMGELLGALLPLAFPLAVSLGAARGTAVGELARRCVLWPGLLWLLTVAMGAFGPALFRP
ncbi:MAG: hypothetical protein HYU66_18590 [Armatimonadetes bacterium]|nr:hypothetical protein [Armatimonadota bacterium]